MGIVYTTSKPTLLFRANVQNPTESFKVISDPIDGLCCRSPRLSPDMKTLIWLERDLNERAHACVLRLKGLDLSLNYLEPRLVIETVEKFNPVTDKFAGLNRPQLPDRCFINNDEIVFSDVVIDKPTLFRCNINNLNDITPFEDDQCNVVLDVSSSKSSVLFSKSSFLASPSLWIGILGQDNQIETRCILQGQAVLDQNEYEVQTLIHSPMNIHQDPLYRDVKFASSFVYPLNSINGLILQPHGGPHSVFTKEFSNDVLFFLNMGYAVLRPNYRGMYTTNKQDLNALKSYFVSRVNFN